MHKFSNTPLSFPPENGTHIVSNSLKISSKRSYASSYTFLETAIVICLFSFRSVSQTFSSESLILKREQCSMKVTDVNSLPAVAFDITFSNNSFSVLSLLSSTLVVNDTLFLLLFYGYKTYNFPLFSATNQTKSSMYRSG